MIYSKKTITVLVMIFLIFLIFFISACSKKPLKPAPKSEDAPPEQPKVIEEFEGSVLKIMTLADKVPYFERVIVEKQKSEEEKKMEQAQMAQSSEQQPQAEKPTSSDEGGGQSQETEQPKPMTIEEGILDEVLKREKESSEQNGEEKPPKDISGTWQNINTTIRGLHNKWNVLEPLLIKESMSPEVIAEFEDTLDKLTNLGIDKNYFGTITTANKLTSYLPKFMTVFKKEVPPTVYTLKYHVRDVVLNTAVDNYPQAQESLNQIKEQGQSIKSELIEKKAKDTADKFDASVINLQNSLDKKDINLIKINGAIVMKNVMLMKDDLAASM